MGGGGTAEIGRPEDCWGCAACLKACPSGAVSLYLAASLGGRGSRLTAKSGHRRMHWRVTAPDGATRTIIVNSDDADNY
jgi:adenylylsulfate reductase subunit B